MELGRGDFGCAHYRRRCKITAPCCGEVFGCRHCHNEVKNSLGESAVDRHDIPRHQVEKVICSLCCHEQDVQQNCGNCGVCMGMYFCKHCKFFDDDDSKNQYHCNGCGICRIGGEENFFHCHQCGCCYSKELKRSHRCVEKAMHHNCPVCFEVRKAETVFLLFTSPLITLSYTGPCSLTWLSLTFIHQYLFDSMEDISVLMCGHTIHLACLKQLEEHFQYACPLCLRSICDMSRVWEKLDQEVAATPMPELYRNKMVWILCNDCSSKSEVPFHIIAHKCLVCNSYNTQQTRNAATSPTRG